MAAPREAQRRHPGLRDQVPREGKIRLFTHRLNVDDGRVDSETTLGRAVVAEKWLCSGWGKKKFISEYDALRWIGCCFGIDRVPFESPCKYETDVEQMSRGPSGAAGVSAGR